MSLKIISLALLAVLTACQAHRTDDDPSAFIPITGKGRLLAIDNHLGIGTLEIDGEKVNFWWQSTQTHPSITSSAAPATPAPWWSYSGTSGNPQFPLDTSQVDRPFNAHVGEMVYFRGFAHRGEILLIAAAAIKP